MISQKETIRRVNGYIERMKRDSYLPRYDLDEQGVYQIYGGSKIDCGSKGVIGVVNGRFIDAIAYASSLDGFLGDWCSWDLPENCNHGYLKKIEIKQLKSNPSLDSILGFAFSNEQTNKK